MALRIDDPETEALVAEVARLSGVPAAAAIHRAVREQLDKLRDDREAEPDTSAVRTRRLLRDELWPMLGAVSEQEPIPAAEQDQILGYGTHGA